MKIAKTAFYNTSLIVLSLLSSTGVAWGLAQVESRSYGSHGSHGAPRFEEAQESASAPSMDILRKMEFLQQEVQELRGKVEEQNYQLQQMQDHQKKLYMDLDQRLRDGTQATAANNSGITLDLPDDNVPAKAQGAVDTGEVGLSEPDPQEKAMEEKAYQNAYHLIQNKDYEKALSAFKSLVKTFPQGKYVPNAQYWLGEIYLNKGSLELAEQAFETVYHQYSQHPKAADSLLKLGYVAYAKGEWKQSQTLLAQVKNQFPGSTSAQLADSRLQRMHHEGHI